MEQKIIYAVENAINADEFISILNRSGLGERRPVEQPEKIERMLKHANLIITARLDSRLVGVARAFTDFAFCTYLSDLAIDRGFQKAGIGKELIRQTKLLTGDARLILLSAPAAVNYYPGIGMKNFEQCYVLSQVDELV